MADRTTADILRAARERIADPERWTRKVASRGADGHVAYGADAVAFCALGSIWEEDDRDTQQMRDITGSLADAMEPGWRAANYNDIETVEHFNDTHTHAEVLAAFDRAIELAEADCG